MYVPPAFREDRPEMLRAAIDNTELAILISTGPEGLIASHVPMLLDEGGSHGVLVGHIARANPQWRIKRPEVEGLAIFTGPEAYISPNWYATKRETGKVVPTWNYVAVHAYGRLVFFDAREALREVVTRLTKRHERAFARPWEVSDAPADFIDAQLKGIVGFRIEIARLEGKWKMSQNRPLADREGVIGGLRQQGGAVKSAVADAVAEAIARGKAGT
ncbi:MAG: FMN-binding negative transcriptional regulator [Acetobacteraceae bacterium]